ncbi:hypothetical protein BJY04DRAFT_180492, partial [Aspergillus karnatakaensis]|uniref:uncharacterized protein n=1 Tax=Aspergillus karnatakaensis TaxID=1810916 RepID=UPI003CCD2884
FDAECLSPRPAPTSIAQWLPSKRPRVDSPPPREPSQHVEVPPSIAEDSTAHLNPPVIEPPGTIITAKKETEQDERPPAEKGTPQPIPILPSLPLEIKPPPPPISTSPYTTHITPTLETLTKRLKSPRTYNPSSQTRALDNLERGYWFLRISLVSETESESAASWTTPFFSKFWTFLSDFIAKEARAGWGVWCILEEEKETGDSNANTNADVNAPSQHTAGDPPPEPAQTNLTLKIYTWGEIASHIYLLLFLASDRRVRKMGAQWRDATDEVVIQMP